MHQLLAGPFAAFFLTEKRTESALRHSIVSLASATIATVFCMLSAAHVAQGRAWYLPSAIFDALLAALLFVLSLRWRGAAKRAQRTETSVQSRSVVWAGAPGIADVMPLPRPLLTLALCSGVAQLGTVIHVHHGGWLLITVSAVVAAVSALLGFVAFSSECKRDARLMVLLPAALTTGTVTREGVLSCTLFGVNASARLLSEAHVMSWPQPGAVALVVSDLVHEGAESVTFTLRCVSPSNVDWVRFGVNPLLLVLSISSGERFLFSLPMRVDDLRPRFVPA